MKKSDKQVIQAQLSDEEKTLKDLKAVYNQAKKDVQQKIEQLNSRTDLQNLQSIIYQKTYQEAILTQINDSLDKLSTNQYKTVSGFLNDSYNNGYIGEMYRLQKQTGCTLVMPVNERKVYQAITTDSKISTKKYGTADPLKGRLAENVSLLKTRIRSNLSRGVAQGQSWLEVAQNIASGMNNPFEVAIKDTMRIVRTEGHRINQTAYLDACNDAKDKGADIVKQWDATLDDLTRESHQAVDGEIREIDEPFSNGLMFPGDPNGPPEEVINCRCQLLQRAKWALDDDELKTLQDRAEYFGLDKSDSFETFKDKYLNLPDDADSVELDEQSRYVDRIYECETMAECKTQMKEVFDIELSDIDKIHVSYGNMMIYELAKFYDEFGNLSEIGVLTSIGVYPKRASFCACYAPGWKEVFVKNVKSKNVLKSESKHAKEQFGYGFWSTDSAEQVFRHEVGHAVENMMFSQKAGNPYGNSVSKFNEIDKLRQDLMEKHGVSKFTMYEDESKILAVGEDLSYYALKSTGEFVAESVAEYMAYGDDSRQLAKKVVEILKRKD